MRSKRGRRRRDWGRRWRGLPRRMRCYHICIIKINPISPCSHPNFCQKLNREVRHSPTWHSSESESALERFEPVAAAMLWSDGQGTLFAPVAARRQKVFKRGIDTYAKHVCRRRRDGSQFLPLFVLFVLFGQAKRTLKEKNHKATVLLSYFSSLKSTARQLPLTPARSCRSTSCISCRCRRGKGHFCLFSRI